MKNPPNGQSPDTKRKIAALLDQLRATEQELKELTGGNPDAIPGEGGTTFRFREDRDEPHMHEAAMRQAAVMDSLPAHIALLDAEGVILSVNEAWRRFASANVLQSEDFFVGQNYLGVCESAHGDCAEEARAVADGIRSVLAGRRKEFYLEYPCHSPAEERWFRLMVTPLGEQHANGAVVMHVNVTDRRLAEEALRESQTLLRIAGQAAHLGGWSLHLPGNQLTWSEETFLIHDLPVGKAPTLEEAIRFYAPEYRDEVTRRVRLCVEEGVPFDFELEFITARQRRIWVRAIGEAVRDVDNRICRVQGAFQDISRQKAAEEMARTAAERLLNTLESITDGFFTLDHEWCFTYVNTEAERLLGLDRASLLGRNIWDAYRPAVGTVFEREYRRAVEENRAVSFEEHYPPLDMWVEVKAYPTANGLAVYFRDVSERRRTQEALEASESRFRQLADSNVLGIITWDNQGNICEANDTFLEMTGFTREELHRGHVNWKRLTPLGFQKADDRAFEEIAATGRCTPFEKELVHKDGRRVAVMLGAVPVDGETNRGLAFVVDVSQQKQAEAKVRASEASLVQAQRIAHIGSWDYDVVANRVDWSAQAYHLYGVDPGKSKIDYQTFLDCVHPDDREWVDEAVQACVAGAPYNIEHRVQWPDGTVLFVQERGEVIIRDSKGRATKMSGTIQDITDRKIAETALAEKTRALQLLSRCNEALIRSESEIDLLKNICRTAVEIGGFQRAWVGYAVDDAAKTIVPKAHAGTDDDYLSKIAISWDDHSPNGHGPAGRTIRSGEPTVIPDLEADESFQPWLEAARASGIRGTITLPLKDATRTFGVLGLHLPVIRHPQPDEMHVLRELADDLAFGITNIRDRFARRRMQAALLDVATAVSATTGKKFFEQLADNMARAVGAQAGFVAEFLPGEPLEARTIAAVVDGRLIENFDYAIKGTPCEGLTTSDTCMIQSQLGWPCTCSTTLSTLEAQSYVGRRLNSSTGKPLGLLFVLFREPLQEPDLVSAMLQIFAARAASELERQETDARLREQATLLDKARDAILVRDLNHNILYWNQSAERFYGWRADEALGRSVRDLLYHNPAPFDAACEKLMATGEWTGELEQVTKAGAMVTISGHWSLVRDEEGNPHSVLAINSDITERKKVEAQHMRAQRMESIGTLAGGIAHDLNNMLAPIMMSIELLKMNERDPQRIELLTTIEGSAKRGADMVRQVLSFARGVEGRQMDVRVGLLIGEIKKIAEDTFLKSIEVRTKVPPDLWLVQGDPTQLHQVLLNLCVNARDAMPNGGTLTLSACNLMLDEQYAGTNIEAKPGPHVAIHVEDTGTGIPPEVLERIFEPFFTTKEVGRGTGLGLSASTAIIKSHGGFIRVYSEVGMGSRFQIYLPALTEQGAAENDIAPVELPRGKDELILVVDDEAAVRQITRQTLEAFGYRVVSASDGVEGASVYAKHREEIAIVLTDMMMPLMDGPTMIQVLLRMNPKVRIIAASGLNANGMVAKATHAGIKHFIPKPYTAETLLKTLREVLGE